jgi:predicted Zn-dependent protease
MRLFSTLLALVFSLPAIPAELPDLGEVSTGAFSDKDEREVAAVIMRDIRASRNVLDDPEVTEYVNNLGYRLVAASDDNKREFEFFVVKDHTLNAFALPGGFIGVHTGLISAVQNESELAGVLAHEIGHVTQKHIARLIASQERTLIPSLAALAVAILAARSNPNVTQAALASAQAGQIQSSLNYTREHESEADRTGMRTMVRAGFDPQAMATFFERLQKIGRFSDSAAPAYLRTHPLTTERMADMQNRAGQLPYRQVPSRLDFELVRAKVRATDEDSRSAAQLFETQIREGRYANLTAARFGLVTALLRSGDRARARSEFVKLETSASPHPMVQHLGAEIDMARGDTAGAVARLRHALKQFPNSRPLVYALGDAVLNLGDIPAGLALANEYLALYPDDYRLYALKAHAHAQAGQQLASHRAQAEAYVRQGLVAAAIEQLEAGIKAADGDFYQLSSAEARLRELRASNPDKKNAEKTR